MFGPPKMTEYESKRTNLYWLHLFHLSSLCVFSWWLWSVERLKRVCMSGPWAVVHAFSSQSGKDSVHGWEVWILMNLLGRLFRLSPWSLQLIKLLGPGIIQISGPKWNKQQMCYFLKKCHHWPQVLVLRPWGWRWSLPSRPPPPCCCRSRSAPPWSTRVVVLIILAWCHSFLELSSSPLWLEM